MKDVCKNVLGLATFRINYTQHCSSQWIKGLRLAASEEGELSGKAVGWRSYGGTFHACSQGLDMGCDRDLRRCESTSCKQGTQRTQSHTSKKRPRSSKATEDICAGKAMWTPSLTLPQRTQCRITNEKRVKPVTDVLRLQSAAYPTPKSENNFSSLLSINWII